MRTVWKFPTQFYWKYENRDDVDNKWKKNHATSNLFYDHYVQMKITKKEKNWLKLSKIYLTRAKTISEPFDGREKSAKVEIAALLLLP